MGLMDKLITIQSINDTADTLDIIPDGDSCETYSGLSCQYDFQARLHGCKYQICGRCGTVRIHDERYKR